jgi:hypothetical protein
MELGQARCGYLNEMIAGDCIAVTTNIKFVIDKFNRLVVN